MSKFGFIFLAGSLFLHTHSLAQLSTGVDAIDQVRQEMRTVPTNDENSMHRQSVLFSWFRHMIHRGMDLSSLHEAGLILSQWGPVKPEHYPVLDEAYAQMEELLEHPNFISEVRGDPNSFSENVSETDWPVFGGGRSQSGFSPDAGPVTGEVAWKFPAGLAWYAAAAVEDGRVYVASPGLRTLLYCLDEQTGRPVWTTEQDGLQIYSTPKAASRLVIQDDRVVIRATSGSWEYEKQADGQIVFTDRAKHIFHIDKASGEVVEQTDANRVDYRRGYAPVSGDEDWIAFPRSRLDLTKRPATVGMLDTVCVKNTADGTGWEMRVGELFGDILMDGDLAVAGTDEGKLYALNLNGQQRVKWVYQASGPIRCTPAVAEDLLVAATETGMLLGIDRESGALRWSTRLNQGNPRAFHLFSSPVIEQGKIFIGSATKELYCVDLQSGRLCWKAETDDWVRARPFVLEDKVYAATLSGQVHCMQYNDSSVRALWSVQAGEHQIFADLSGSERGVLVSSSELFLYSLNPQDGQLQWKHSLLECSYEDGERMVADVVAGGGDFQSPPTVCDGIVYAGTPSRFVFAVDAASGEEIWRFETSGQVSGAPGVQDGRVYFGQQGGNDEMFCVDARTGDPIWTSHPGWVWVSSMPDEGRVFAGTVDGRIIALDAGNGQELWEHKTNGGVYPSPAVDADKVYTGSWDGGYYALNKFSGVLEWVYSCPYPDSAAGTLWKGRFIARTQKSLTAIDPNTGKKIWNFVDPRTKTGHTRMNSTPSHSGDYTFASTTIDHDGVAMGARLFCLDTHTGKELWHYDGAGGWTGSVCTPETVICGSSTDHFVTCLALEPNPDGSPRILWRTKVGGIFQESIPAVSGRRAYVLCTDGYLYAFQ
ncbi:outer membrane protein assembly factor BamB family protein [Pontiella sulfatireligans]|uniref:Serine/threonine-protein kinase AfsK n=1 Tax=Pontiella sulfatireligans TaxID=2750658 RepID=A0A6C2UH91_9BACT|nr:PQQ-binding-like beta-propeller repeat protein [Pontiella sulfatireligans]VGO19582.1 Serine/threonine-protein kinase AfsK [Pontiella sulfatireligans]